MATDSLKQSMYAASQDPDIQNNLQTLVSTIEKVCYEGGGVCEGVEVCDGGGL